MSPPLIKSRRGRHRHHHHHHTHNHGLFTLRHSSLKNILFAIVITALISIGIWGLFIVNYHVCPSGEYLDHYGECKPSFPYPVSVSTGIMDGSAGACDDFYEYACGKWIGSHKNSDRVFSYLHQKNGEDIVDIIDSDRGDIQKFYLSCTHSLTTASDEKGEEVTAALISAVESIKDSASLSKAMGKLARYGFITPISIGVELNPASANHYIFMFGQSGTFWEKEGAHQDLFQNVRLSAEALQIEDALRSIFAQSPAATLQDYVFDGDFETDSLHFSQLQSLMPWLDLKLFIEAAHGTQLANQLTNSTVWAYRTSYFERLGLLGQKIPLQQWKIYLLYSILYATHDFLPSISAAGSSEVKEHTSPHVGMKPEDHMPWKRQRATMWKRAEDTAEVLRKKYEVRQLCLAITKDALSPAIDVAFARLVEGDDNSYRKHFRTRIRSIVESIKTRIVRKLEACAWMSEDTRAIAIQKAQSIIVRVVHPNRDWPPSKLPPIIYDDSFMANLNAARAYSVARSLDLYLNKNGFTRDESTFAGPLSTVNAYYQPTTNTISLYAGILRPPFMGMQYDDVSLYGSIGMVVGHELSHAFDSNGMWFDCNGTVSKTWQPADVELFQQRVSCLIREYNLPDSDGCHNSQYGRATLSENIADNVGIELAYEACFIDGACEKQAIATTYAKQNFFLSFAQNWCAQLDQKHRCARIESGDPHAIARYRVLRTLSNNRYFKSAFSCSSGDAMVIDQPCTVY